MAKCIIQGLGTHIKVADIEKSREFYESLGFKPVFGYGDVNFTDSLPEGVGSAPEKYRGMTFEISDSSNLEIAEGHIAVNDQDIFKTKISTPKVSAMVKVKSLVPLFTNKLVDIKFPVRKYYWGTIEVAFRDPDGYVLVFITPFTEKELVDISKFKEVEEINPS